jgi:hypothetical protein
MATTGADGKAVGKAFKVEVDGCFIPVKSLSGGQPLAEKATATAGAAPIRLKVARPAISELTIVAYATTTQKVLAAAAHAVANQGQRKRFRITIAELAKDGRVAKTFVYHDCLFTGLDFPRLDPRGNEILCETATFKPERLEVS